ncbi:hypothetical protein [Nocardioides sp.]|uniref:hypothetical protein n=1 Tax=Nocardioides sp. TaxID=35761 RepID=UPI0027172362|nr:hypothetical protein [Nocardioides sp.]MDO9457012.1 hypothetical protein [Nocardioides sp.]
MNPVTSLSLGRIGVGIASLVKPELVASTMGVSPSHPLLTQWFGSREIALGTATLLSSGSGRRTLVLIGAAVDGADAATAYAAVEADTLPRKLGLALVGVASVAVVSGLLGLRVERKTTLAVEAV